jgi:hypothetical protein
MILNIYRRKRTYCLEIQVEEDPFRKVGREGHPEDPLHQEGGHQSREEGGKVDVLCEGGEHEGQGV